MAALATERSTSQLSNQPIISLWRNGVKGGVKIFKGAQCVLNGGYLQPGTAASGFLAAGRARQTYDNTAGADGAITGETELGCFSWDIGSGGDALAIPNIGTTVYIMDDHTVGAVATSRTAAGKLRQLENGQAYVETI